MDKIENLFTKGFTWAVTTVAWLCAWRSFFAGLPLLALMFCAGTYMGVLCEQVRIIALEGDLS